MTPTITTRTSEQDVLIEREGAPFVSVRWPRGDREAAEVEAHRIVNAVAAVEQQRAEIERLRARGDRLSAVALRRAEVLRAIRDVLPGEPSAIGDTTLADDVRAEIERLTRERDEARDHLADIAQALGLDRKTAARSDVLARISATDRDLRATRATLEATDCVVDALSEPDDEEIDRLVREHDEARAEVARLRTYLDRAIRGCDPRERAAILADLAGEEREHG